MIRAHQATFTEFLCVYEESFASLTGETTFLNENAQTISFGVFDDGVLMAEHMICHKIADPNIRLQGGAFVKAGTMTYRQGDARDLTKESRMTVTILLVEKWRRAMRKSFLRDRRRMQRWLQLPQETLDQRRNKMLFKNSIA